MSRRVRTDAARRLLPASALLPANGTTIACRLERRLDPGRCD